MNEFEAVTALFPQDNLADAISDKVRDDVDFAILVRDWLEIKGWTQKELAQKLGMKPSQLSLIVSGNTNLTLKTIRRFERALGVKLLSFAPSPLDETAQELSAQPRSLQIADVQKLKRISRTRRANAHSQNLKPQNGAQKAYRAHD